MRGSADADHIMTIEYSCQAVLANLPAEILHRRERSVS